MRDTVDPKILSRVTDQVRRRAARNPQLYPATLHRTRRGPLGHALNPDYLPDLAFLAVADALHGPFAERQRADWLGVGETMWRTLVARAYADALEVARRIAARQPAKVARQPDELDDVDDEPRPRRRRRA